MESGPGELSRRRSAHCHRQPSHPRPCHPAAAHPAILVGDNCILFEDGCTLHNKECTHSFWWWQWGIATISLFIIIIIIISLSIFCVGSASLLPLAPLPLFARPSLNSAGREGRLRKPRATPDGKVGLLTENDFVF
jgi:hypothetical protein